MEMLELIRRAFAGRRVFLTGHTGFKGGWLALWLEQLGAEVHGYALAPDTSPALFHLAHIDRHTASTIGDIRDLEAVAHAMIRARPDIVMHLAAQPLVRRSYREPVETFASNVMGTVNVLEAVRRTPSVRAALVVSSDKCYENPADLHAGSGFREDDPMGGHDPYSASKGCTELVTAAWRSSFFQSGVPGAHGAAIGSARAGNVIGGGDWSEDRLVPDLVRAFANGNPARIRQPHAVRPWQHVLEPLWGYLLLTAHLLNDDATSRSGFNFGPQADDAVPVGELVRQMCDRWGPEARWFDESEANAPHEAHHLRLDCSKARTLLGWRPAIDLKRGIDLTAAWYREVLAGADAAALCLEQIRTHERAIAALESPLERA